MTEETTPEMKQLLNNYDELYSGDLSKLDVVSESATFYSPFGEIHGRDAIEEFIREQRAAFPDIHVETDDMLAGDDVIMQELTFTGTHEGEFEGIEPTGREVELKAMVKLVIEDGKVREDRTYFDLQDLYEQLGIADEE